MLFGNPSGLQQLSKQRSSRSGEVKIIRKLTLLTCLIFISPNVAVSETMDNLLEREGIWFKKFT
jgi:hypothetical protein